MEDLGQIFGDVVGQALGSPPVQIGARLIVAYLAILWLASAFWVFRDARRRTKDLISPYVAAGGVVALTPFLFPLGVIAYRVVRPPETVTERAARDLESYVLAASVDHTRCRSCARAVDETWMRCPACGADLAVACAACGGRVEFDWSVCAWCAHDLQPLGDSATMPAHVVPIDVPAAMADLGAAPPAIEDLEEPQADGPGTWGEPRAGAIPGWDSTVVLPATAGAPAPATAGEMSSDDTQVGIPVFDPHAPGAAAAAWTATWDDRGSSPMPSSSSARGSSGTERRQRRVTVPPELERRRSR
jgi:predicted RNA-binding Zn-ribbon protein involved in translation (DUF1610 family)